MKFHKQKPTKKELEANFKFWNEFNFNDKTVGEFKEVQEDLEAQKSLEKWGI